MPDILNINNVYFDNMVSQIYPSELHLNKANNSDTEDTFLDLHLSISNDTVSTKIYDKRDDSDFKIVNVPFFMVMLLALHPMVSISLNSFGLLEHLAMLLTSTLAINGYPRNFLNKAIGIINLAKPFLNIIDDTMI